MFSYLLLWKIVILSLLLDILGCDIHLGRVASVKTTTISSTNIVTPTTTNDTEVCETSSSVCSADRDYYNNIDYSDNSDNNNNNIYDSDIILEQILANDYDGLDNIVLVNCINGLKSRGAHRCWHKHSSFLDHLLNVHNILRLWGQGPIIGRLGLFHSVYSNSYVNLALYNPLSERTIMKQLIGTNAEELVYLFCIIDRQQVVVNTLLKLKSIPINGLYVQHLHNSTKQVYLSPDTIRILLIFTMADISEQYFSWQDELFGSYSAMLLPEYDILSQHNPKSMWPGISKPGIYMTYVNQLAHVAQTYQASTCSSNTNNDTCTNNSTTTVPTTTTTTTKYGPVLLVPPVFDNCTKSLTIEDEIKARDLYWSVVIDTIPDDDNNNNKDTVETILIQCSMYNPFIYEPLVLLGQYYLHSNQFTNASIVLQRALVLQQQWGIAWDKRIQFNAWVAWTRVLYQRSITSINPDEQQPQQNWPTNSWDVNNFGLVK